MADADTALTGHDYALPSLWSAGLQPHMADEWELRRRALLELFASEIYGRTPQGGGVSEVRVSSQDGNALGGFATRQQIRVTLEGPLGGKTTTLLLYRPNAAVSPVPCFLGLNFKGNHAATDDAAIDITSAWTAAPAARGEEAHRWPLRLILERGFAVATMHYAELEPDAPGRASEGVRGLFQTEDELARRPPDTWGAVGAWAWGLSRMLDVLAATPGIDGSKVIVHGHSRLGKTALWAAAQDPRFAAVISNNSGCAGASLFRHASGETIAMITRDFPHWFAGNFAGYGQRLDSLPVDQHYLLAALAPRPVHVASATLDAHADPRGEFLSTLHASPIFELFGYSGTLHWESTAGADLSSETAAHIEMPSSGRRMGTRLSYHIRDGGHDVLSEDWMHFLDFAKANDL